MSMLLTFLLDVISTDTLVVLRVNGKLVGSCNVYDFPSRHDLNQYYGNKVIEVKAIDKMKIEVYLEEK